MNKKTLLNTFLNSNSLNDMLASCAKEFNCPLIITDNGFHIVSVYFENQIKSEGFNNAVLHSELPLNICALITENFNKNFKKSIGNIICFKSKDGNEEKIRVNTLKCGKVELGYIIYVLNYSLKYNENKKNKENKISDEKDCLFAEQLLAKQFFCEKHSGGLPTDTTEEIIIDLLNGKFKDEELFKIKIAGTFLAHFTPERFAVISISSENSNPLFLNNIQKNLKQNFSASHPLFYNGKIILFLHKDHDTGDLQNLAEEYNLKVAVSSKINNIYEIKQMYDLSLDVFEFLSTENNTKNKKAFVINIEDYLLSVILNKTVLKYGIFNNKIKELYNYDATNKTELCLTLYTYLICKHSLALTGEKLFTHRNTVQYRLNKIRGEFLIDTDNSDEVFLYLFYLKSALIKLNNKEV